MTDVDWDVLVRGGISVFSVDSHLRLKRLQLMTNGDLKIISDNKAYETETIARDELEHRGQIAILK